MPASASAAVSPATTPTIENGMDPATRRQRQSRSQWIPSGTESWPQTTESSSAVRVIEENSPSVAQDGIPSSGPTLHTPKFWGSTLSERQEMNSLILRVLLSMVLIGPGLAIDSLLRYSF